MQTNRDLIRRLGILLAVIAAASPISSSVAAEPSLLAPRTPWTLDFAEERCSLIRDFGDEGELRLQIDSFGSRSSFRFAFSGTRVPRNLRVPTMVRLSYSSDTFERPQTQVMHGELSGSPAIIFPGGFFPNWDSVDPELVSPGEKTWQQRAEIDRIAAVAADSVEHMTIEFGRLTPLQLQTGSMAKPMDAMRACVDDLIAAWGVDPNTQATLSRFPTPLAGTVRATERSIRRARLGRGYALFPVQVVVDETGQARRCKVSNGTEATQRELCSGLMGSYQPGLDANGRPVPSLYLSLAAWLND